MSSLDHHWRCWLRFRAFVWADLHRHLTRHRTTALCLTLTLLLGSSGFWLRLEGFLGNVLAELAGVTLSVLIAFTLVERLLLRQRREQWIGVSRAIRSAISSRVDSVACDFYCADTLPDAWFLADTAQEHAAVMEATAARLTTARERLAKHTVDDIATTRQLHRATRADLGFVRDVLTPRVVQLGDDAELVEALVALEEAERLWNQAIQLIYDNWGFPAELAWERAAGTLSAAARLYRLVAVDNSLPS